MYLGNPVIVSLSSLFGRVTIKGCDAQDWDLRHSSPLFLEGVLSLISGLNDVCMHVVGYLVVFVFSQKKKESRGEHLLPTHSLSYPYY